jgi:predicted CoA-binding protein
MLSRNYKIIPVNPTCKEVLGLVSYAKLSGIPAPVG